MYRYQVPTRNTITSSVVDRPDPTFHFDADPDRRNPDRQAWMPFPIRQNDADPDPQHDNKLRENKTKAKGIRIDEGKRGRG
jgi:hypothetical protein